MRVGRGGVATTALGVSEGGVDEASQEDVILLEISLLTGLLSLFSCSGEDRWSCDKLLFSISGLESLLFVVLSLLLVLI